MSWNHFHIDDPVTFDDSVCNFGRVFYHDTISDKVHIMTRIKKNNSVNTWQIVIRDAKDVRRAIIPPHTWNVGQVFNIMNPPPSPPPLIPSENPSSMMEDEPLPHSSLKLDQDTMLSKFMSILRFT